MVMDRNGTRPLRGEAAESRHKPCLGAQVHLGGRGQESVGPSNRRTGVTRAQMGMGAHGGWNILAQGLCCRAESVKSGESLELYTL